MSDAYHYPTDLELVHYPDPVLRRPTEEVTAFDAELRVFCQRMFAAMEAFRGVGLAAPQVGVSKRIFVTNHAALEEDGGEDQRAWINPRIEPIGGTTVYEEGCLSFPNIYAKVERHDRFRAVWHDLDGQEHSLELDASREVLGIVYQHELDHLDGILFVDHLSSSQLTMVRRKLQDLEKAYKKATGKAGSVLRR